MQVKQKQTLVKIKLLVWFLNKDFEWNLIFVLRPRGHVGVVALFVLHRKDLYYMHFRMRMI